MSIPVELDDLPAALARGGTAYLLSTGADGRVKAVAVRAEPLGPPDHAVRVPSPGRGTLANAAARPALTLLLAPATDPATTDPGAMTLLVDGTARVQGDDVLLTPTGAVWHRPPA